MNRAAVEWSPLLTCAVALAACGEPAPVDDSPDALVCEPNAAPRAPELTSPAPGRIDVVEADLVIGLAPFSDDDAGDVHGATEVEIYRLDGDEPVARLWRAEVARGGATALDSLTFADGAFDVPMTPWTDYAIRARVRDDRDACSAWSPWSAPVTFRSDDGSSYLFDPDVVRDVYLDIPPESLAAIDAEAVPPWCVPFSRAYHPATLTFDGAVFPGVGIHVKGGCGSSRNLSGKPSFKLKLDWDDPAVPGCPDERRLHGQKHLVLNNNVQDRTMQHERMAYELERAFGVPTPRANTVRVHVNGEYWGVYTSVEAIDRRMLQRWFEDDDGMLYEGTYWCDLVTSSLPPLNDPDTDDVACLTREFKADACSAPPDPGDDPTTYAPLRELVAAIEALPPGGYYPAIAQLVDFDTFLSQWAIESVLVHWDAYQFAIINNYRVYRDPAADRWTVIPTGLDQTFLGDLDPWDVYGVLAVRCVQEPACDAAFAARLAQAVEFFQSADLAVRAREIHEQLRAHVLADPRKEYTNEEFDAAYAELQQFLATRPARVREYLTARGY